MVAAFTDDEAAALRDVIAAGTTDMDVHWVMCYGTVVLTQAIFDVTHLMVRMHHIPEPFFTRYFWLDVALCAAPFVSSYQAAIMAKTYASFVCEEERQLKNTGAGGCAMRQYMDHPTSELWQRLQVTTAALRPTDVVVGMHLRLGDSYIFENVTGANGGPYKVGGKLKMQDVEVMHQSLEAFVSEIERDPRLRVRMFVASDVPAGVENVKERWGERMLPLRNKIAFHTNYGRAFDNAPEYQGLKRALFADLVSDWFFLAMADVMVQPMGSSFSQTAGWLGMHGPCHKDFRRGLVSAAAWGPCVKEIVGSM